MSRASAQKVAKDAKPESLGEQLELACRKIAESKGKPISLSGRGDGWSWSLQIGSIEVTTE